MASDHDHEDEYLLRAGRETARADFRRGMSMAGMQSVPQPSDAADWAAGYREECEHLWLAEKLWEDA